MNGDFLNFMESTPVSVVNLLINLGVATVLVMLLSWHFKRFGTTFSNRSKFSGILPALTLTTLMIITVVKASLALSLGLVGALSIVRFRTPVKEPEELTYVFLAIGIGLGLGADQRLVTVVAVPTILTILAFQSTFRGTSKLPNLYVNVAMPREEDGEGQLTSLIDTIKPHVTDIDLRRYDIHNGTLQATFHMGCRDLDSVVKVQDEVTRRHPRSELTFVEQASVPGS